MALKGASPSLDLPAETIGQRLRTYRQTLAVWLDAYPEDFIHVSDNYLFISGDSLSGAVPYNFTIVPGDEVEGPYREKSGSGSKKQVMCVLPSVLPPPGDAAQVAIMNRS